MKVNFTIIAYCGIFGRVPKIPNAKSRGTASSTPIIHAHSKINYNHIYGYNYFEFRSIELNQINILLID